MKMSSRVALRALKCKFLAFVIDFSYLLFHTCFFTRPESATFLLATVMAVWRTKNCAISHPLLNEWSCIREYSTIRLLSNRHWNDLKEMYSIGLNFEYSRMKLHSLSSGCEIAQFFVRYMAWWVYNLQNTTNMRDAWRTCCEFDWRSIMLPCWVLQKSSACYHHVDVFLCNNSCRDGLRPTNSSFFQFGFSIRKCVLS